MRGKAAREQPHGARDHRDRAPRLAGLGGQPDVGTDRHHPLEGRVELDRDGARLHVLHVHVHAARQLELAGRELHLDQIGGGGVGQHP
jgi:hypothetical protein